MSLPHHQPSARGGQRQRLAACFLALVLSACGASATPAVVTGPTPAPPRSTPTVEPAASNTATDESATNSTQTCPDAPGPITAPIIFGADNNLLAISPDGEPPVSLTALDETQSAIDPAWSPDGQTLVYTLNVQGVDPLYGWLPVSSICAFDRATGQGRLLARSEPGVTTLGEPAWTPDNQTLLLNLTRHEFDGDDQYTGSATTIARYTPATELFEPLIPDGSAPTAHPDGTRIAYLLTDLEIYDVILMHSDAAGQNGRQLVGPDPPFGTLAAPRWSPDGRQLTFTASGGPSENVGGVSPIRAVLERLLDVHVAAAHGPPANLWLVDADGQGLRILNQKLLDDPRAAWSPDGGSIAYTSGYGGVYLLDLATGQQRTLTERGNYGGITWAPR